MPIHLFYLKCYSKAIKSGNMAPEWFIRKEFLRLTFEWAKQVGVFPTYSFQ